MEEKKVRYVVHGGAARLTSLLETPRSTLLPSPALFFAGASQLGTHGTRRNRRARHDAGSHQFTTRSHCLSLEDPNEYVNDWKVNPVTKTLGKTKKRARPRAESIQHWQHVYRFVAQGFSASRTCNPAGTRAKTKNLPKKKKTSTRAKFCRRHEATCNLLDWEKSGQRATGHCKRTR
jgi:hypothetical protein